MQKKSITDLFNSYNFATGGAEENEQGMGELSLDLMSCMPIIKSKQQSQNVSQFAPSKLLVFRRMSQGKDRKLLTANSFKVPKFSYDSSFLTIIPEADVTCKSDGGKVNFRKSAVQLKYKGLLGIVPDRFDFTNSKELASPYNSP
jgi:hypothetical protein